MARSTRKIQEDATVHYIPPRKKRQKGKAKLEPPLTPMIDVTFQLLIYFLLTATFRAQEGQIPGSLPTTEGLQNTQAIKTEKVRLLVIQRGDHEELAAFRFKDEPPERTLTDPTELYARLRQMRGSGDEPPPLVIECYSRARWGWTSEAYNQAVRAGFRKIAIQGVQ